MTVIKSLFVGSKFLDETVSEVGKVGANHLIITLDAVNQENWRVFKETGATLAISVNAFDRGACPLDPRAKKELEKRVRFVLKWEPDEAWFDHFRFDGHWEAVRNNNIPKIHKACRWCEGKERVSVIRGLAEFVVNTVGKRAKTGYFAVPFKKEEVPQLVDELGQDHSLLGEIFDIISPMLYHRMIEKPASYISEYVKYLHNETQKPVLPIIQIKDMPDNLPDNLEWDEFKKAFDEAKSSPSVGVSIFYWTHVVEKDKTKWIERVFKGK